MTTIYCVMAAAGEEAETSLDYLQSLGEEAAVQNLAVLDTCNAEGANLFTEQDIEKFAKEGTVFKSELMKGYILAYSVKHEFIGLFRYIENV